MLMRATRGGITGQPAEAVVRHRGAAEASTGCSARLSVVWRVYSAQRDAAWPVGGPHDGAGQAQPTAPGPAPAQGEKGTASAPSVATTLAPPRWSNRMRSSRTISTRMAFGGVGILPTYRM